MIPSLGYGLNIVISCEYTPSNNWMSYLSWYSISKNLPEAKVFVSCKRSDIISPLFIWTKKASVPFKMHSKEVENVFNLQSFLVIPPHVLAIRDFQEAFEEPIFENNITLIENTSFVKEAKTNEFCVFCSYLNGWGNFVTAEWINSFICPLLTLKKFSKLNMTINEKRIEKIWSNSISLFNTIRG